MCCVIEIVRAKFLIVLILFSVVGVDSSKQAIDAASLNLSLNKNLDQKKATFIRRDAIEYMKECVNEGAEFDVIILDPPKLAPNMKSLENATSR